MTYYKPYKLQQGGFAPYDVNSIIYQWLSNNPNKMSYQIISFTNTGKDKNYTFTSPLGSESTVITPDLVNIDLGNETAYSFYKKKNPEAYNYHKDRLNKLSKLKHIGVPGNVLPEITIKPTK